ncbi:MAG: hypothetical protein Kow0075_05280 [Salibacteraceae bacterium]
MRGVFLLGVFGLFSVSALLAQPMNKKPVSFQRHYNDVLPHKPQFKLSGWLFAPGATYMLTPFIAINKKYDEQQSSIYQARIRGIGKPGLYLELGRYKVLPYARIFSYIDYGINYTSLRGSEKSEGQYVSQPDETPITPVEVASGTYGFHYVQIFFNANHLWRTGKFQFIQHSLGLNGGYAFLQNQAGNTPGPVPNETPGAWLLQLHYKLGYGIKLRGNWLVIPSVETPILGLLPFDFPRSSMAFFGSRYRPLIFSLRFMIYRPANTMECTPVRTREGLMMPTDIDKQRQMNDGVK